MSTYRSAMRPRATILTTATFTGASAPGLQRRPIWDHSTTDFIFKVLHEHHCRACSIAAEATGTWRNDYTIKYESGRPRWVPNVLADIECKILQIAAKRKADTSTPITVEVGRDSLRIQRSGPCFFRARLHHLYVQGAASVDGQA